MNELQLFHALTPVTDDIREFFFHHLSQHSEADADRQGQKPFPGGIGKLTQYFLHPRRQISPTHGRRTDYVSFMAVPQ